MMKLNKVVIAMGFATLALTACNSSTDNSADESTVSTVSGKAAKGLIFGGLVNIHPIINGELSDTIIASGLTTDSGSYSVNIPDYDGSPFVVRVTSAEDDSTRMRCDLAGGCGGGVSFGEDAVINDATFNLDAIVPPFTSDTTSVNLSVLTDTASSVAIQALSSNTDVSLDDAILAITNANTSVGNRFGIVGDITALPIVDLTDPIAVAGASNNEINFNLFSASIVEALIGGDPTISIADSVAAFANQYTTTGGLADTEESADPGVTLAEILAQASAVIDAIQANDTDGLTDLAALEAIIDQNEIDALQGSTDARPGSTTPSTPSVIATPTPAPVATPTPAPTGTGTGTGTDVSNQS